MSGPSPFAALPRAVLLKCGALSFSGMAMLMLGAVALAQPSLLPALAPPSVAWPLIIVGSLLETGGMTLLLGALRAARSPGSSDLR